MNRSINIAFLIVAMVVPTTIAQPPPVQVPEAIKVPDGHKLVATYEAKGDQVYVAVKGKTGDLEWKFDGPRADLSDAKKGKVGSHYGGPTWEAADGSKVVKPVDAKATPVDAKNPMTDLPWLLIPVIENGKPGIFSGVVYVQRVSTSGGMKPADLPKRLGAKVGVPYTAVYYFWTKPNFQLREGKLVIAGEFSADAQKTRFTIDGEPGKAYTIIREGAAEWLYLYDSSAKLISHGWEGEFTPKVTTYYHQPDANGGFQIHLPGYSGQKYTLTITSQAAPKAVDVVLKDGKFELEAKLAASDGAYLGHKQKTYLLKAAKNQKFKIETNCLVAVRDQAAKEMVIKDEAGKDVHFTRGWSGKDIVTFEAPADGVYRILVVTRHSTKYPEGTESRLLVRITQE